MFLSVSLIIKANETLKIDTSTFKENDFIHLREMYSNNGVLCYLVIHIETLHLFFMKKANEINQNEINFCENCSHRCFSKFYGFLKENDKEITGFI